MQTSTSSFRILTTVEWRLTSHRNRAEGTPEADQEVITEEQAGTGQLEMDQTKIGQMLKGVKSMAMRA